MFRSQVIGNLGSDAKVENNNGRPFVSFSVGHNDRWVGDDGVVKESTQWISCALNGDGGKLLSFLKKGRLVFVEGRTSTRIYSSQKERKMVAGVNISVDRLELVGAQQDNMPKMLADESGVLHNVNKAYYINPTEAGVLCDGGKQVVLMSQDGRNYKLSKEGWVSEIDDKQNESDNGEQSDNVAEPF